MGLEYVQFAYREARTLLFGLSFTFFSSFGQTFLISLFVPYFLDVFSLSNASFGTMYAIATLCSAASLPYLGGWIDDTNLKTYGLLVALGLALASFTMALAHHVVILFLGLYLLRLTGQGLSSHTAKTSMARHYSSSRGKALSIVNLGHPIGEGVLPLVVTAVLSYITWRTAWGFIGGTVGFLFVPFVVLILGDSVFGSEIPSETNDQDDEKKMQNNNSGRYWPIITDSRFWLLAPAAILPGFWVTGLFLYQVEMASQLNWTKELLATAFIAFAIARILFSLLVGPAIDRWSARRLFPLYLLPLGGALMTAYYHPGTGSAFLYMSLLGVTLGAGGNLKSSLWAEVYGTDILGTVRSLYASFSVLGTAACPLLMGWALDLNVAITTILLIAVGTVLMASILSWMKLTSFKKSTR